jgi:CPA2 family monovalent cation:H+ antiporter-2
MEHGAHATPLITTIVAGLVLAFILGALAQRLRVSPLVGYLLAGVLLGPYTPGFVASTELAPELAEIGVILLMFGIGMHFSIKDLASVIKIAVPGAVLQIAAATLLGLGFAKVLGWSLGAGLVFGLCLSVASTVVLVRAIEHLGLMGTERGRIAVGWLVVEDIAMILALVILPAVAQFIDPAQAPAAEGPSLAITLALTVGKVALFIGLMLVVGRRVIPAVLHYVAWTGSRELFRLAVLAIGLGVAFGASQLFGVSFALGAFFAGLVMAESELSQRAAEESLPLRDAFAVLFFVSVGMLFDPMILVRQPLQVLAVLFIITIGKSVAAYFIVRLFGHPRKTALTISASLAQIGEFSFILAGLAVTLGLMPEEGRTFIITGALLSILLNPLWFALENLIERRAAPPVVPAPAATNDDTSGIADHAVIIGYGRVGRLVADGFLGKEVPVVVVETRDDLVAAAREKGHKVLQANAAQPGVGNKANLGAAKWLFVAIPNAFEAAQIVEHARKSHENLTIIARAHFDAEVELLQRSGATDVIMGEREIATAMLARAVAT